MIHAAQSELAEDAKKCLQEELLEASPPPTPCMENTTSNPEIIDISQDDSTPAEIPSSTLLPTPPPLPPSPTNDPSITALVPLQQAQDTYMTSTTTTIKRQATSSPRPFIKSIKKKGPKSRCSPDITSFFSKAVANSTKSAENSADLAN